MRGIRNTTRREFIIVMQDDTLNKNILSEQEFL